jgi:hypothetical protein
MSNVYVGGCHCGAIGVELSLPRPIGETPLRRCGCSFCRKHAARTVADPAGRVVIAARNPLAIRRYRFGLGTADYLVCACCGVYVAAVLEAGGGALATLNVNVLEVGPSLPAEPPLVSYDGESLAERVERRRRRWTPARLDAAAGR